MANLSALSFQFPMEKRVLVAVYLSDMGEIFSYHAHNVKVKTISACFGKYFAMPLSHIVLDRNLVSGFVTYSPRAFRR